MKKNYYDILGITEEEKKSDDFHKILKTKYRELCKKFHPDKYANKEESEKAAAEEKFKEIAEAYSILGDDDKRKTYDNPQSTFNSNFGGSTMEDILREMEGMGGFGGFGRQTKTVAKGQSIRLNVSLSLEEIYNGVGKKFRYKRMVKCTDCDGHGTKDANGVKVCPHCGGSGQKITQNGIWQQLSTCPNCQGGGKIVSNPCKKCGGNGLVSGSNEIEVTIPKGVFAGMTLSMDGYGHIPLRCEGVNGDLLINISEATNNKFIRNGNDLNVNIEIPIIDAILGCETQIVTINGTKLTVKIPQGVDSGTQIRFANNGMPIYNTNRFGNMIGTIKIKMPKKLSNDEKTLLNQIKEKENFK